MARPKTYVGVDIGATKTAVALVDPCGHVSARHRRPTPDDQPAPDTFAAITGFIEDLLDAEGVAPKELAGIGVAVPGVVDPQRGTVVMTPNTNLSGVEVVAPLEERFGAPVALGNDANLGTLGESWRGAARSARSVVGIFWGTGIGGGLILNGELLAGSRKVAGEIGHMVMRSTGPQCGCGNRGCLEALAGRLAIERDIRKAEATSGPCFPRDKRIKSKMLKRALARDDDVVTRVMTRACRCVGDACLTVRHLLDPEVIVLGGGVIEACGKFVMPIIHEIVERDSLPGARGAGRIVESQLGDDAVILGAVALARRPRPGDRAS